MANWIKEVRNALTFLSYLTTYRRRRTRQPRRTRRLDPRSALNRPCRLFRQPNPREQFAQIHAILVRLFPQCTQPQELHHRKHIKLLTIVHDPTTNPNPVSDIHRVHCALKLAELNRLLTAVDHQILEVIRHEAEEVVAVLNGEAVVRRVHEGDEVADV